MAFSLGSIRDSGCHSGVLWRKRNSGAAGRGQVPADAQSRGSSAVNKHLAGKDGDPQSASHLLFLTHIVWRRLDTFQALDASFSMHYKELLLCP